MKTPKSLLLLQLLWLPFSLVAQVQWYQTQDGNNPPPNGTFGSCAKSFTPNSFVGCYQWTSNNEEYTWKIAKSHINGTEQKTFFVSGTWASAEMRASRSKALYVLLRSFPSGQDASFTLYKLDTNLVVKAQRSIVLPNNFSIFNINVFEKDESDNIYLTGDGQYPNGDDFTPASFVLKTDKNLNIKWKRMENSATSFAHLQVDPSSGKVVVIEDFYTFFPQLKIRKYSASGALISNRIFETDPGRFNLMTKLDDDGNLLLYGGKTIGDTAQGMYLYKLSRHSGNMIYNKTHFATMGFQLNDLVIDNNDRIFSMVTQYMANGGQQCVISRINSSNGNIQWNRTFSYADDSSMLSKLVVDESDRFYAIGQRMNNLYLSKGVVIRIKKNGQTDGGFNGPDSIGYQRSHTLVDGLTDRTGQLITIGNTNDFDPYTYNSTYFRAFAVRFGQNNNGCDNKGEAMPEAAVPATEAKEEVIAARQLVIYPNPVQNQLTVSQVNPDDYDRVAIYDMRGAQVLQQLVNNSTIRLDISSLTDGMYLLVLRSSVTLKEKTVKFVVRK